MKLANQVAIITGAGRNIGEAIAKKLASEGAAIAVVDLDKARGDKVAADIVSAGGKAKGYVCDVSKEQDIIDTVKGVVADFGRIDILVNNAAKEMIAAGHGGKMINTSSTSGFYGRPRSIAYTSAKAGIVNLTRSMAMQLAAHNIRVNCVVPNKIGPPVGKEEFNPNRKVLNLRGREGTPDDLAKAVLFLVSDDSDFIDGTHLMVDGGCSTLMPGGDFKG